MNCITVHRLCSLSFFHCTALFWYSPLIEIRWVPEFELDNEGMWDSKYKKLGLILARQWKSHPRTPSRCVFSTRQALLTWLSQPRKHLSLPMCRQDHSLVIQPPQGREGEKRCPWTLRYVNSKFLTIHCCTFHESRSPPWNPQGAGARRAADVSWGKSMTPQAHFVHCCSSDSTYGVAFHYLTLFFNNEVRCLDPWE
jgi:hypothetical protein